MIIINSANPSGPEDVRQNPKRFRADGPPAGCVRPAEFPAVVTVTAAADADAPVSAMQLGDTEQVDCVGAPLQLSVTVWLNPPPGVSETI
jgi:hypothetical protein